MKAFKQLVFAAILSLSMSAPGVLAAVPPDLEGDDSFAKIATHDGKKLVEQIYKALADLRDYKFDSILYMCKPDLQESGAGTYFFKRPDLVRLQVRSNGLKNGTIVVKQPDGRIRVSGGSKLRFLKMNVDPDSRVLQTPNGFNVIKSDLATLFASVNAAIASGSKAEISPAPVSINRFKQNVTILQLLKQENGAERLTDRIFIDPKTDTPVEWDIFRNGNRYSVTVFDNFTANLGLPDDEFNL
jgi:outer membrane lipoprotein-sorting protein